MTTEFAKGQTVFNTEGRSAIYVARVDDGHIVQPIYEDGDGVTEPASSYAEGADLWPAVHATPPREKLHAEVAKLEERAQELRLEVYELEGAKREAQKGHRETAERLKQQAALRYIDDLIEGRMPPLCLQLHDYYPPTIVATADALKNPDADRVYREPALKLLVLFGNSKGDLQWQVNQYHDGSGNNTELFFCATEAEAIAEIGRRYALAVDEWRGRPDRKHYGRAISWAEKLPAGWITVPQDVQDYLSATRREAARQAHDKALKTLADAEAALRAAETA